MIRRIAPGNSGNDRDYEHRHIEDVRRIQRVLYDNGYMADLKDCENIWDEHSDMYAAGWLNLPESDEELFHNLEYFINRQS